MVWALKTTPNSQANSNFYTHPKFEENLFRYCFHFERSTGYDCVSLSCEIPV